MEDCKMYHDPAHIIEAWMHGEQEEHEPEMVGLSVRIPTGVMRGIDELAETVGMNRSALVRDLLSSAYVRASERLLEYEQAAHGCQKAEGGEK